MKRLTVLFTAIFFVMLLLPVSWELAHSYEKGEPFAPLDIFRDVVRPFERESAMISDAYLLNERMGYLAALVKLGDSTLAEKISTVDSIAETLKRSLVEVNSYLPMDSTDSAVLQISQFQKKLAGLESDTALADSLHKMTAQIQNAYASFSLDRVAKVWWNNGILNGKYLRAYEKRLEKENAFVKKARPLYQSFAWKVLRDPGEKALNADSSFLYYRQDVDFLVKPAPWTLDSLENPIEAVLDFKAELEKRGVELLVVVVPGKPSIYPEFLNSSMYSLFGKDFSLGRRFVDTLQVLGVHTVNLYPVLQKEKQNDRTGDLLYLNTDTHWTPRGARIAAKAIAEQVKKMEVSKELPKLALKDSIVTAVRTGDIATMADLEYAFPDQTVEAHQVKDAKTGAPLRSDFRKSKILILGDSYSRIYETDAPMSAGWISQFANEMQTPVASIVSDGGASTLVREKLARRSGALKNKKLVIWEFVERDLRFGAEGWKKVRFD